MRNRKLCIQFILVLAINILFSSLVVAQYQFTDVPGAQSVTIDFDSDLTGINNDAFQGDGFSLIGASGSLDPAGWKVSGITNGPFGEGSGTIAATHPQAHRGVSTGGVTDEGIYAFDVDDGGGEDWALGIQMVDDSPVEVTAYFRNNTGCELNGFSISADIFFNNNGVNNAVIEALYSTNDADYTSIGTVNTTNPGSGWQSESISGSAGDLAIATNGSFYLKFSITESGSGAVDEVALDNISLQIIPGATTVSTIAVDQATTTTADVTFSGGTGDGRVMFLNTTSTIADAVNETDYSGTASSAWANSGEQAVFAGSGTSFSLSKLSQNTTYYYEVWEYHTCAGSNYYNVPALVSAGSFTTFYGACLDQEFTDTTGLVDQGWVFSGMSLNTTDFGLSSPSLSFADENSFLEFPLPSNARAVSFWLKAEGGTLGNLVIQDSPDFSTHIKIYSISEDANGYRYYFIEDIDGFSNLSIYYDRGGNDAFTLMTIDDIKVYCGTETGANTYTYSSTGTLDFQSEIVSVPSRTARTLEDELIFNSGGVTTLDNFTEEIIGTLSVTNGTHLKIVPSSALSELFLAGNGSDSPLEVCATCSLTIESDTPINIVIGNGEDATIDGTIIFEGNKRNQIIPLTHNSLGDATLAFNAGANFYNNSDFLASGESPMKVLGDFRYQQMGGVSFKLGANYYHNAQGIAVPFEADGGEKVVFESGSNYYFQPGQDTLPYLNGKTFGNFIYNQTQNIEGDQVQDGVTMDTLKVSQGSLRIPGTKISGGPPPNRKTPSITLNGSIEVVGGDSLIIDFTGGGDLTISSAGGITSHQIIAKTGYLKLADGAGLVIASGGTTELVPGSGVAGDYFTTLVSSRIIHHGIWAESDVTIAGTLNLENGDADPNTDGDDFGTTLTVTGVLTNTGTVNVRDDASIVQTTGSSIAGGGTYNVDRVAEGKSGTSEYYFWSTPMNLGDANVGPSGTLTSSRIYKFNQGEDERINYSLIGSNTDMVVGEGYAVWELDSATFTGTINNGDITYPGAGIYNDGDSDTKSYSLVGNPYPSAISVEDFLAGNLTNIDQAIYLFSHYNTDVYDESKQYIAVNAAGSSDFHDRDQTAATTFIASGQGFMVQASTAIAESSDLSTSSYDVHFTNGMRSGFNEDFKSGEKPNIEDKFWLRLYREANENEQASILVAHSPDFSWKYESGYDAAMGGNAVLLGLVGRKKNLGIAALPHIDQTMVFPLYTGFPRAGYYHFESGFASSGIPSFQGFKASIFDADLGTFASIDEGYSIYMDGSYYGDDRFHIVYSRTQDPTDVINEELALAPLRISKAFGGEIELFLMNPESVSWINVYDGKGAKIANQSIFNSNLTKFAGLQEGIYIVSLTTKSGEVHNLKVRL